MERRAALTRVRAALAAVAVLLGACGRAPPLDQQAYVWQRQSTPALAAAVTEVGPHLAGLRVLVAERIESGWVEPDTLAALPTNSVATLVLRWDARRDRFAAAVAAPPLARALARAGAAGAAIRGVEVDYDCGSARLADYARELVALRATLPPATRLSITALPAWLDSADLDTLLATVDENVLQVHSVDARAAALVDPAAARRWAEAWSRHAAGPWRIALPVYGARVWRDAEGAVRAVESESELPRVDGSAREWRIDTRLLAALVGGLRARPPAKLAGIVWFRLPTRDDRRAVSVDGFVALLDGRPLAADWRVDLRAVAGSSGGYDLVLENHGNLDAAPPASLRFDGQCSSGDAAAGVTLERDPAGGRFRIVGADGWLRAGQRMPLGWLHCASAPIASIEHGPS